MKIGIVIPLKAKSVAKNWDLTCRNLDLTIKSICNQTSCAFRAVVVGHDCPDYFTKDYSSSIGLIEFLAFACSPPPVLSVNETDNQVRFELDRCAKIMKGMMFLNSLNVGITHWYALDADDLINKNFVKTLIGYGSRDAFVLDYGYHFFKSTGIINKDNEFSLYCGSSTIISTRFLNLPQEFSSADVKKFIFGGVSHVHMKKYLVSNGVDVCTPDERLVMYVRDNGENISNAAYCNTLFLRLKKHLRMILKFSWNSRKIKDSFSILL